MHQISNTGHLSLERLRRILDDGEKLSLSPSAVAAIEKCRHYLDAKMADIDRPVYGITTGFGSLYNVSIPPEDLSQLQHNLVMSHACGTGATVRPEIVKLMLLPKASTLWHSAFFTLQLSHPYMTTGKTIALTRWTFVDNVSAFRSEERRVGKEC